MSDKSKLVKRLEKFLPTALADQIAEEVVDSLWLAEHDEEVRAGVVAEEPEWAQEIRAMHRVKRGVKFLYAPDDRRAEREPIGEEEYFICDYDKTTWPCKTQQILGAAVPVKQEGAGIDG